MKIYKKRVKGKLYSVARERLHIAANKTQILSKSFGAEDLEKNLAQQELDFLELIIKTETDLRIEYWSKKVVDKDFVKYCSIRKIEELRTRLIRRRDYFVRDAGLIDAVFMIDFIYNSNKIEGSKLPKYIVEEMVNSSSGNRNNEVINTVKAINFLRGKFVFNARNIKKLHSMLLAHENISHDFRDQPIVVGNSETLDWQRVKGEIKKLLAWLNKNKKTLYPPLLAFEFYYRFERIHPFEDGNGRVGRLLMNKILKDHKYHPMIIWDKNRTAHFSAFKKAIDGRMAYYYKFMTDQMMETYREYLKKI